jgi:hypothetical protein
MESPKYNRIRHQSIPAYLSAIREKVAKFGKDALTLYDEPRALVLGFRCKDELHLIGLNNIRAHYNIGRVLPNIPGLVLLSRNSAPPITEKDGIEMFLNDCKGALG